METLSRAFIAPFCAEKALIAEEELHQNIISRDKGKQMSS